MNRIASDAANRDDDDPFQESRHCMPQSPANDATEPPYAIEVYGARTHNLKGIDVKIPLGLMTVVTGVSGSGKSSLAFDTIFAEGRHRYLSTVSARSRELLQRVDRPDVDSVDNLPPVLCVEQRMHGARSRATVCTVSDIYDFLRLLFARVGQLHCPDCHLSISAQSRTAIVSRVMLFPERQKVIVLAPLIRGEAGIHAEIFARIVKDGFIRARVDGQMVDASDPPVLDETTPHDVEIVVDRLIMKEGIQSRLEESIDLALRLGDDRCVVSCETDAGWQDHRFATILSCTNCGRLFQELEPRTFSFNSAIGACPTCHGQGVVISDELEQVCGSCHGSRLGPVPRAVLIDGISIAEFCALTPTAAARTIDRWRALFSRTSDGILPNDGSHQHVATAHILPDIAARLQFLVDVGLDYLTLDRGCQTVSAGELQRARLAACLGHRLTGVCYILDEPTAGLHSRDTQRLLRTLVQLRDEGNTVLLVEHDLDVIRQADYVIDLGPGAGTLGGTVLGAGTPDNLVENSQSITGQFLASRDSKQSSRQESDFSPPSPRRVAVPTSSLLRLAGATLHNLKHVTLEIPLNQIVCVTGVSGSGKTSLVMQTLVPAVRRALGESTVAGGPFEELAGTENLSRLVRVDQSPLGRSARSSPATYSGLWNEVRQIFAKTKESRLRGYTARRFSLSVPEARCPVCAGRGQLPVEERRFTDWTVRCPECDGRRFAPATLSVRYKGQSVADVLEMSIADAAVFFENLHRLARTLNIFNDLGLGYLKLGQSATTLSGGEAQRIKLGTELAKSSLENSTLFVLDEPTSGLHVADIDQLITVLRGLVECGHSILVIEHNVEFIAQSDWVIDIGPGAGPEGGNIVSAGIRR